MLLAGVRGLLRLGELTADDPSSTSYSERLLRDSDARQFNSAHYQGVELVLRMSKTDIFHEAVNVPLFATRDELCAVTAIQQMQQLSPFPRDRSTPLFQLQSGHVLSRPRFVDVLQRAIARVAVTHDLDLDPARFTGHSLRRGGATSLFLAGAPDRLVQLLGRWRSDAYKVYVVTPRDQIGDMCALASASVVRGDLRAAAARFSNNINSKALEACWWARTSAE